MKIVSIPCKSGHFVPLQLLGAVDAPSGSSSQSPVNRVTSFHTQKLIKRIFHMKSQSPVNRVTSFHLLENILIFLKIFQSQSPVNRVTSFHVLPTGNARQTAAHSSQSPVNRVTSFHNGLPKNWQRVLKGSQSPVNRVTSFHWCIRSRFSRF